MPPSSDAQAAEVEEEYEHGSDPSLVIIDGFFKEETLEAMREFAARATVRAHAIITTHDPHRKRPSSQLDFQEILIACVCPGLARYEAWLRRCLSQLWVGYRSTSAGAIFH